MCILEYCHLKNKMMNYETTGKENTKLRIAVDKNSAVITSKNRQWKIESHVWDLSHIGCGVC